MKQIKTFTALFAGLIILSKVHAQPQKGDLNLNAGIGIGFYYYSGSSLSIPPIGASIDYNVEDKFSVGGIATYSSSNYIFSPGYRYNLTYIIIGVRGNYHFLVNEKIDPYIGAVLAYNLFTSRWTGTSGDPGYHFAVAGVIPGLYFGGRYKFNEKLGVFLELGYPMVRIGLTAKIH